MRCVPPRRHGTLLLAVLLGCSTRGADAAFTSCLQRAMSLLQPCQPVFGAVATAPAAPGGGLDVNAALAALGGSLAALPTSVRQCCAALAPVNDANCLCDTVVADAVSTFTASASAAAGSIMPQARHACMRFDDDATISQAHYSILLLSDSADIMFEITSVNTGGSPSTVPIRVAAPLSSPPPIEAQSVPPMSPPPMPPQPPAMLAFAAAALDRAECPAQPQPLLALALCAGLCRSDADCHGRHACCSNGCGRVCYAAP